MKIYKLDFVPSAFKEWKKLGTTIKEQFKKKLSERMKDPHIPKDRLSGGMNLYKIKLRSIGYRLVYQVKREGGKVYKKALELL